MLPLSALAWRVGMGRPGERELYCDQPDHRVRLDRRRQRAPPCGVSTPVGRRRPEGQVIGHFLCGGGLERRGKRRAALRTAAQCGRCGLHAPRVQARCTAAGVGPCLTERPAAGSVMDALIAPGTWTDVVRKERPSMASRRSAQAGIGASSATAVGPTPMRRGHAGGFVFGGGQVWTGRFDVLAQADGETEDGQPAASVPASLAQGLTGSPSSAVSAGAGSTISPSRAPSAPTARVAALLPSAALGPTYMAAATNPTATSSAGAPSVDLLVDRFIYYVHGFSYTRRAPATASPSDTSGWSVEAPRAGNDFHAADKGFEGDVACRLGRRGWCFWRGGTSQPRRQQRWSFQPGWVELVRNVKGQRPGPRFHG